MKWHKAKKKPIVNEVVLITPSRPMPLARWDGKKWISALYPLPAFPCEIRDVKKWAYIDYPKKSFEYIMSSRKKKSWWKRIMDSCLK